MSAAGELFRLLRALTYAALDGAQWLDNLFEGRRPQILLGAAAACAFLPWIAGQADAHGLGLVGGVLVLLAVISVMVGARLGSLRPEEGSFTLDGLHAGIRISAAAAFDGLADLAETVRGSTGIYKLRLCLNVIGVIAIGIVAISNVVLLVGTVTSDPDILALASSVGALGGFGIAIVIGGHIGAAIGDWQRRRKIEEGEPVGPFALPAMVDASDRKNLLTAATHAGTPALSELLKALSEWQPRRLPDEKRYQRSLQRHLDAKIARGFADPRFRFSDRRAPDFVLSEVVLMEMKRRIHRMGDADRAIGQFQDYARRWGNRGPVVLLVCDPDWSYTRRVVDSVNELRAEGRQAVCILIPPRGVTLHLN